jgi:hypothetical protein
MNGGNPPVAATPKPGVFHGPGVVPARTGLADGSNSDSKQGRNQIDSGKKRWCVLLWLPTKCLCRVVKKAAEGFKPVELDLLPLYST